MARPVPDRPVPDRPVPDRSVRDRAALERSGRVRTGPVDPRPALAVHDALAPVVPGGALVRGQTVGCAGPAALSLATALTAVAVEAGSWLAVIGVPTFGVDAAAELGVPPSRTVVVRADRPREWAERVAAAVDGIDLVLTAIPTGVPDGLRRSVLQRVRSRGAVLVTVPSAFAAVDVVGRVAPSSHRAQRAVENAAENVAENVAEPTGVEIVLRTEVEGWYGTDHGAGRLLGRRVVVTTTGRRVPRSVRTELWLPGPDGTPRSIVPGHDVRVRDAPVHDVPDVTVVRAASA